MTPLESRRLLYIDNVLDKSIIHVKFARAVSKENIHKNANVVFNENIHVNDKMRRVSSFYKRRYESVTNLLKH